MKFQELVDRATQAAQGIAGAPAPQVDREITAQVCYPHAVRSVYRDQAKTGKHLSNLMNEYMIETYNGEGTIPDEVLREYLDRSYLPRLSFASMVPWEEYPRYRFDKQMSYYATRGATIAWTGNILSRPSCTASAGSSTITGDASAAEVGDRFYLYDATNGLIFDGTIASINGVTNFTVYGKTLAATTATTAGIIYSGQDDQIVRSVTDASVSTASQTVTSATAAFTTADVGRRVRVYPTNPSPTVPSPPVTNQVADMFIVAVPSATTATMGGKATAIAATQLADILYEPLVLQAVGIPALPSSLTDDLLLSPEIAEDTIVRIASVLRGEIALQALIDMGMGGTRKR